MCTVIAGVFAYRVVLAANRDERLSRPWDCPAEHWPGITGGRDRVAGGTWLATNAAGVACAVLNRTGSLGPAAGKISRGELPLRALAAGTAADGAIRIAALDAGDYRPFNLVVADRSEAWFVRGFGKGRPEVRPLPPGVTMVTAHDLDDVSPRVRRHLPRFAAAAEPTPDDHAAWAALLFDGTGAPDEQLHVQPHLLPDGERFGTVCSALVFPGESFLFGGTALSDVTGTARQTVFRAR